MQGPRGDFDVGAFHTALDRERRASGLTWADLARELNRPIADRPDIPPISASTLAGMTKKSSLNGNIVVNALRWLDRSPESFVPKHPDAASQAPFGAQVPDRFGWDFSRLYADLDAQRAVRGLSWAETAREIGITGSSLSTLARGGMVGFPRVMRLTMWLGRPATDFVGERVDAR